MKSILSLQKWCHPWFEGWSNFVDHGEKVMYALPFGRIIKILTNYWESVIREDILQRFCCRRVFQKLRISENFRMSWKIYLFLVNIWFNFSVVLDWENFKLSQYASWVRTSFASILINLISLLEIGGRFKSCQLQLVFRFRENFHILAQARKDLENFGTNDVKAAPSCKTAMRNSQKLKRFHSFVDCHESRKITFSIPICQL